jgi:hypothetical protein
VIVPFEEYQACGCQIKHLKCTVSLVLEENDVLPLPQVSDSTTKDRICSDLLAANNFRANLSHLTYVFWIQFDLDCFFRAGANIRNFIAVITNVVLISSRFGGWFGIWFGRWFGAIVTFAVVLIVAGVNFLSRFFCCCCFLFNYQPALANI